MRTRPYKLPRYVVSKTELALGWTVFDRHQNGLDPVCNHRTEAAADVFKDGTFEACRMD
jgi:hypothetical protein